MSLFIQLLSIGCLKLNICANDLKTWVFASNIKFGNLLLMVIPNIRATQLKRTQNCTAPLVINT